MSSNGFIKSFLPEKNFGFITGEDKKNYYFQAKDVITPGSQIKIHDGAPVEFHPTLNEKGYRALKIIIKNKSDFDKYITPDKILTSKTDEFGKWEIVKSSEWCVTAQDPGDPDAVRERVKQLCASLGANGVSSLTYRKNKGQDGNYEFTIHTFIGRPVFLAKRDRHGTLSDEAFPNLNANCVEAEQQILEKEKIFSANTEKERKTFNWIITLIVAVIFIADIKSGAISLIIGLIVASLSQIFPPAKPEMWLKRVVD